MALFQNLFSNPTKELAELEALFSGVAPKDMKYLACFSLLLAKVAGADNNISDGEKNRIRELLIKHAGMSPGNAQVVSEAALKKSLVKSLDVKAICDEIVGCASPEQLKNAMLSCLYVASDGGISETEVQRMHAIARMLGFSFKAWQSLLAEFNGTGTEQAS